MSLFIGLMTGTSLDGIDASLIDYNHENDQSTFIAHYALPMPNDLRQLFLSLNQKGENELHQSMIASWQHAELSAKVVEALLKENHLKNHEITAIGSHGQTVRHCPNDAIPYSIQLQNPARIAELTGINTVADFRVRDIVAGGQGAPLAPAFQRAFFSELPVAIINIGGISNITILEKNHALGWDISAGNCLLDSYILLNKNHPYDLNGEFAKSGKIIPDLLEKLKHDAYHLTPPPKSTGRDYFHLDWLNYYLSDFIAFLDYADIQRTLLELSALTIVETIQKHYQGNKVVITGGGAKNIFLMERIRYLLPNHYDLIPSPIPVDALESAGFGWLASQYFYQKPINLTDITGGKNRILGAMYYK